MKQFKSIRIYVIVALLAVGYYAYTTWYGIAYWQTSVIKDTEHTSGSRVRGVHGFYHK